MLLLNGPQEEGCSPKEGIHLKHTRLHLMHSICLWSKGLADQFQESYPKPINFRYKILMRTSLICPWLNQYQLGWRNSHPETSMIIILICNRTMIWRNMNGLHIFRRCGWTKLQEKFMDKLRKLPETNSEIG